MGLNILRNEEFHDLHSCINIIRLTISRKIKFACHFARMGKGKAYTVFVENPEGKSLLIDLDIDGQAVLKTRIS